MALFTCTAYKTGDIDDMCKRALSAFLHDFEIRFYPVLRIRNTTDL